MRSGITPCSLVRESRSYRPASLAKIRVIAGFLFYLFVVTVFAVVMIYRVAPTHGKKNPVVYTSICSVVGSISVMAIKVGLVPPLPLFSTRVFCSMTEARFTTHPRASASPSSLPSLATISLRTRRHTSSASPWSHASWSR